MIQAIVGEFKKPAVVNLFLYIYSTIYISWFRGEPLGGTSDHEKRTK